MKIKNIIYSFIAATALTACSESDLLSQATLSDEAKDSKLITFEAGNAANQVSRASTGYREWDIAKDPSTMGVFGWFDLSATNLTDADHKMFDNVQNIYGATDVQNPNLAAWTSDNQQKWTYVGPKYWADYTYWSSFDFFAYMPYQDDPAATVTSPVANQYKLKVPSVSLGANAVITDEDTRNFPLICALPKHLSAPGYDNTRNTIPFQFDQTLAGMKLEFQLGTKMGEIRQFRIKEVKLVGAVGALPISGDITRTYTWADGAWSAGDVIWESLTKNTSAIDDYDIPNLVDTDDNPETAPVQTDIVVTSAAKAEPWGTTRYFIPDPTEFTPTIRVTYDVEVLKEDGNEFITRKNVTSDIVVNSTNFPNYNVENVKAGNIITLHINIVPDYLYVLSDFDHTTGVLVVDTTPKP